MEDFNRLFHGNYVLSRKLVKESIKSVSDKGFWRNRNLATHFSYNENDKPDCGTFKFVHNWQNENETWKIKRIITYGH